MTAKDRALQIAAALALCETDHPGSNSLPELHKALLDGLEEQADALGLTAADVAEIEGEVAARGGGTNKSGN